MRTVRQAYACLAVLFAGLILLFSPASALADVTEASCPATLLTINAAPGTDDPQARPQQGWEPVSLPETWTHRWPGFSGPVWYRIDWQRPCSAAEAPPLAMLLDSIGMSGEIHLNDTLLWRDRKIDGVESLSWNQPRWWLFPAPALRDGINQLWIRVDATTSMSPGLGRVLLGPVDSIEAAHDHRVWRQRTLYYISLGLSVSLGLVFLVVWCLHPAERAFGWYALLSLFWTLYLFTLLGTTSWPFSTALGHARLNICLFVLYVTCFCLFTWRFGEQRLPRLERLLWVGCGLGTACALFANQAFVAWTWLTAWLVFCLNCVQFQWHAWRTRKPEHLLLALCWLIFLVIAIHDLFIILEGWQGHESWSFISGPVASIFIALLLGGRLAFGIRRIKQFNHELQQGVHEARLELGQALAREHAQALAHAKLQERLHIVHDLHDGLGSSLVRGMALVEQSPQPLGKARTLSLLKTLRDDLRQIIDHGSSASSTAPETPIQWIAPLRHRFTHLFDEMDIHADWRVDDQWRVKPSALQCLGMMRVVEEALSNLIKHSRARSVSVSCHQDEDGRITLVIQDDGIGFDLDAVRNAGQSVGMRSMAARAERLGGKVNVQSSPAGTRVTLTLKATA